MTSWWPIMPVPDCVEWNISVSLSDPDTLTPQRDHLPLPALSCLWNSCILLGTAAEVQEYRPSRSRTAPIRAVLWHRVRLTSVFFLSSWPQVGKQLRPAWAWETGWCPSTTPTQKTWPTWRHRTPSEQRKTASPWAWQSKEFYHAQQNPASLSPDSRA